MWTCKPEPENRTGAEKF